MRLDRAAAAGRDLIGKRDRPLNEADVRRTAERAGRWTHPGVLEGRIGTLEGTDLVLTMRRDELAHVIGERARSEVGLEHPLLAAVVALVSQVLERGHEAEVRREVRGA